EPQSSGDVPLVSAVGVDYTKLRDLLVAKNWKEADLETAERMLEAAGRESQGYLDIEDVKNFPCQDLGTIDKLWVKYSGGKFGFSVQKQIFQDLGGTKDYDRKVWQSFGDKVGWRKGGILLSDSDLTFSEGHCMGHLPLGHLPCWHLPWGHLPWAFFGQVVARLRLRPIEAMLAGGPAYALWALLRVLFSRAETCRL
ncbi:MAG: GUN4 domain-containing protein, partial [Trichodesmium sp. St18_bin1]|nr:GUN4 domain-containing protein [Trichodesmium sp. St18_bin1]